MEVNDNILNTLIFSHIQAGLGHKTAITDVAMSCTYSELSSHVRSFSKLLDNRKISFNGEVVVCLFSDSVESVICFLGLIYCGAVPCYLNPDLPIDAYGFYLNSIKAEHVFISREHADKFGSYLENNGLKSQIFDISLLDNFEPDEDKWAQKSSSNIPLFCSYTSGTTGHPSAVLHRHKDVEIMNTLYAKGILEISSNDVLLTTSKMYFAYGLNSIFMALYHGATAILITSQVTEILVAKIFNAYKPTVFFSVPRIYKKLLAYAKSSYMGYIPRICVSAGETLGNTIFMEWRERFSNEIIDGIGSTETLSTFISNRPGHCKPGSTGKTVPGFQCEIRDAQGKCVKDGQYGVLWVRGDTYPCAYLNNHEASNQRFKDGWFSTNDIFSKDPQGNYYYNGRVNDLIYRNGIWIFPKRVENRINEQPGVSDSMVMCHKSNEHGVILIAVVEVEKDLDLWTIAEQIWAGAKKDVFYREENIDSICFVELLPRTFNGKVTRTKFQTTDVYSDLIFRLEKQGPGLVFDAKKRMLINE